jgi:4-hydroxy-2-oxoheptanedioate aldolase
MADIPRLNGVIRALEAGKCIHVVLPGRSDTTHAMATAKYDGIVTDEHNPWDIRALQDSLQYMLNRGQIAKSGSVAPTVTPMVHPTEQGGKSNFMPSRLWISAPTASMWPHLVGGRGVQRGCRLPLSAPEER